MINMEAIPKFDIKSVIISDIKFDISTKPTTWIGHKCATNQNSLLLAISQYVKTKLTNLTVQAVLLPTMLRRKRSSTKAIWKSKCHFFLNCIS